MPKSDETATQRIYEVLLERFGEPIAKQKQTVGAADEGPDGKALWNDEPKHDREWSDPHVVKEDDHASTCTCNQCGAMKPLKGECSCGAMEEEINLR